MPVLISTTEKLQHLTAVAVTLVTILTAQDVPVSLVEAITILTAEAENQAVACLATATIQVLPVEAAERSAVAQAAARHQVPLLQVKVEAHQAAVVINS